MTRSHCDTFTPSPLPCERYGLAVSLHSWLVLRPGLPAQPTPCCRARCCGGVRSYGVI